MVPRFAGSILGLLSFSIAIFGGLMAGNPIEMILQRAVYAMLFFWLLGLGIGAVAQMSLRERARDDEDELEATSPQDVAKAVEATGPAPAGPATAAVRR